MDGLLHDARQIRPIHTRGDTIKEYEPVGFTNGWDGVSICLRRLGSRLKDDGAGYLLDVLDGDGTIIQDFPISRQGMDYLRATLKIRVDRRPAMLAASRREGGAE